LQQKIRAAVRMPHRPYYKIYAFEVSRLSKKKSCPKTTGVRYMFHSPFSKYD